MLNSLNEECAQGEVGLMPAVSPLIQTFALKNKLLHEQLNNRPLFNYQRIACKKEDSNNSLLKLFLFKPLITETFLKSIFNVWVCSVPHADATASSIWILTPIFKNVKECSLLL